MTVAFSNSISLFFLPVLSLLCSNTSALAPPIIACKSTAEVKDAISVYIKPSDSVLELGAQLSEQSSHLCRTIGPDGRAMLVDVKRKEATSGRSIHRDTSPFLRSSEAILPESETFFDRVEYKELDQFDHWRNLTKENHFQAMVLDVGSMIGNDLYLTALSLASEFIANQEKAPNVIIVKSKTLSSLARRIIHSQRLLDGTIQIEDALKWAKDPIIIPSVGVNDYRKTIPFVVNERDDVLEVGCHAGTTTALLHAASSHGFCAGVDIGPKIINTARKQHPEIVFECIDAWNMLDLLKLKSSHDSSSALGYDIIYADIGGLSGAHGLLESLALIDSMSKALEPRAIIIKSLCMRRLASQLVAFTNVRKKIESKEI